MFFNKNKKTNKRKWLLFFGVIAVVSVVATSVVSCSTSIETTNQVTKEPTSTAIQQISNINLKSGILNSPLQVLDNNNKLTTVSLPIDEQQEFILAKYYYSGKINHSKKGIGYITNADSNNFSDVIMMAPGDSLVLVFNQNSKKTILQMHNYINTLYFDDTSIGYWARNQQNITQQQYIKFNNTEMAHSYYGSQTNHLINPPAFGKWLNKIAHSYKNNKTGWENLLKYYGYKENTNGTYAQKISSANSASTIFYPLGVIPKNLWTIKQVASNAFAFIYNANIKEIPSITYANISQILTNVSGNTSITVKSPQITQLTPALSLGTPYEWNFYMNTSYSLLGQKLSKHTPEHKNINADLIIDTFFAANGTIRLNMKSYIKYLSVTNPTIAIIINTNLINNLIEKYNLF